jgi:AcrR family transcriptional regulator
MPKLWSETVAEHRDAVRDAILDATAALVAERGLTGVTMSGIAQAGGIGRATLYKYFPDVASILAAWHQRQVVTHLQELVEAASRVDEAGRLEAVLRAYAQRNRRERGHGDGSDLAAALHGSEHVRQAHGHLRDFLSALIADAAARGQVRTDVPPAELAAYCLSALNALGSGGPLSSKAAADRLVTVVLAGLAG